MGGGRGRCRRSRHRSYCCRRRRRRQSRLLRLRLCCRRLSRSGLVERFLRFGAIVDDGYGVVGGGDVGDGGGVLHDLRSYLRRGALWDDEGAAEGSDDARRGAAADDDAGVRVAAVELGVASLADAACDPAA